MLTVVERPKQSIVEEIDESSQDPVSTQPKVQNNPTFKEFYDSVKKGEDKFKHIDGYTDILKGEEFRGIGLTQEMKAEEEKYQRKSLFKTPAQKSNYTQVTHNIQEQVKC